MANNIFLFTMLPIIQAPMAGIQDSALTIAVSSGSGLGSLTSAMISPKEIRTELTLIKFQTGNPFNINFFYHNQPQTKIEQKPK